MGKAKSERKTKRKRARKEKEEVLAGISRSEMERRYREVQRDLISLSVLFIDVLSASLVPTGLRALSFLYRCLVHLYIVIILCVSLLSTRCGASHRESWPKVCKIFERSIARKPRLELFFESSYTRQRNYCVIFHFSRTFRSEFRYR